MFDYVFGISMFGHSSWRRVGSVLMLFLFAWRALSPFYSVAFVNFSPTDIPMLAFLCQFHPPPAFLVVSFLETSGFQDWWVMSVG